MENHYHAPGTTGRLYLALSLSFRQNKRTRVDTEGRELEEEHTEKGPRASTAVSILWIQINRNKC